MKYFLAAALIIFMGCKNNPAPETKVPPAEPIPAEIPKSDNGDPQPQPVVYNDNLTPLSMSNSLDRANVNDILTIFVEVKNTGNDICTMCNAGIRYSLKDINGTTVLDSDITDGISAINNLMPGEAGTIKINFKVAQTGNYTFYLTDLFGVFKGTNSTKHFAAPGDAKTYLTVL